MDSIPFGYVETELNAADEYDFQCSSIHKLYVMARYASVHSIDFPQMYL